MTLQEQYLSETEQGIKELIETWIIEDYELANRIESIEKERGIKWS